DSVFILASDGLTGGDLDEYEMSLLTERLCVPLHGSRLATATPDALHSIILEHSAAHAATQQDDATLVIAATRAHSIRNSTRRM
ncbi:MAG: hypothetical protein WCJ30_18035, partial [Deltaproteobacteria bacterium]